jgi:hypothetical protein
MMESHDHRVANTTSITSHSSVACTCGANGGMDQHSRPFSPVSIRTMRVLTAGWLTVLFLFGASVGIVLGLGFFAIALLRRTRPIHRHGVVCYGELLARDAVIGPIFAGPVLVRWSGAFADQLTGRSDVLGVMIRLRRSADASSSAPVTGDQDLLLGSFESFRSAARDRAATNVTDYLANRYSTVTPWWIPGVGAAVLRLSEMPGIVAAPPDRGGSRLPRLDTAMAGDRARLLVTAQIGARTVEIAELRLVARAPIEDRHLRASIFRSGRGIRPVGFRNGIRATVYPLSQFGRWLRVG